MINSNKYTEDLDLAEGQSIRKACPQCGKSNTFTATKKDGKIMYNCYSLSCGLKGAVSTGMTRAEMENYFVKPLVETFNSNKELERFVYPEYVVNAADATDGHLRRFVSRWELLRHENLLYDIKDRRAVFPIWHKGIAIDAIGRALDGAVPKWYRYGGTAEYYRRSTGIPNGVYVLVEDVISAITVAKRLPGTTGFAILGTSLTAKQTQAISDNAEAVIVALDPDAVDKTLKYKREVELWTGLPTKALHLEDDIKYERTADMAKLRSLVDNETKGADKQAEPYG